MNKIDKKKAAKWIAGISVAVLAVLMIIPSTREKMVAAYYSACDWVKGLFSKKN